VDITASGAGGLDTGAEGASTWYYLWVIWNPATGTVKGLFSTSSSAPTMPSGYTFKLLVGAARNDGSSNLIYFWQEDNRVWTAQQAVFAAKAAAAGGTYEVLAGADLTAFTAAAPAIAKGVTGTMRSYANGAATASMTIAADVNGIGEETISVTGNVTLDGMFLIPLTQWNLAWKAPDTTVQNSLWVRGWWF
jgi:hypothetical protein